MALLADGLHMASHTAALGLSVFAYAFARRRAHDSRFSFGTGKFNPLAGFASAIVLVLFALLMVVESIDRFMHPVAIAYNEAIIVAVLGLVVNGISVFILRDRHSHHEGGRLTPSRPQSARRLPACARRCLDLGARHRRVVGGEIRRV